MVLEAFIPYFGATVYGCVQGNQHAFYQRSLKKVIGIGCAGGASLGYHLYEHGFVDLDFLSSEKR